MSDSLVVFEQYAEDFGPLALTRPVYGLRVGTSTLAEKIADHECYREADFHFQVRDYLAPIVPQIGYFAAIFERGASVNDLSRAWEQGALFVDGAVIASLSDMPALDGPNEVGIVTETLQENGKTVERRRVVYVRADAEACRKLGSLEDLLQAPESSGLVMKDAGADLTVAAFPWDLVINSGKDIEAGFKKRRTNSHTPEGIIFLGERDGSYISETADIGPGAVIDTRGGGVYIGDNVEIQASVLVDAREGAIIFEDSPDSKTVVQTGSQVYGPVYIGTGNQIKQATVREGCCFGPTCRVGGELEEVVIIGYSNKQHFGYMGHAVIGEWVNWGAGTTNSDLKNDYSNVVVELNKGRHIDSLQNKTVGCYIGDHTKTALGAFFNTGTVVGVMSNILMNQVTEDKYLPHFAIYDNGRVIPGRGGVRTGETVMGRRGIEMTPEYKAMMKHLSDRFKQETREMWRATRES